MVVIARNRGHVLGSLSTLELLYDTPQDLLEGNCCNDCIMPVWAIVAVPDYSPVLETVEDKAMYLG
jgi:hypothetical protein